MKENDINAFPGTKEIYDSSMGYIKSSSEGMTLRDWFAGQAITGIISNAEGLSQLAKKYLNPGPDVLAKAAYDIADAMLEKRAI